MQMGTFAENCGRRVSDVALGRKKSLLGIKIHQTAKRRIHLLPTVLCSFVPAHNPWRASTESMSAKNSQLLVIVIEVSITISDFFFSSISLTFFFIYLYKYKNQLHHREGHLHSRVTVDVAHIADNLEHVHDNTEESEQHKTS